ncbi:S-adenosyl-L-methionine-dependent methyltransferase [Rhypophila decipiens]|uniref:S-adenosyl-L-methionine-dependent methyltransferase n=1 Tax=Rhypophila decipiens TaxID=261697 RepID=A0AAN6Y7T1_9PEZI|nr:S-adenosyl-L-methionine-dependent methyltransferase [Rhypophila decipiens]
MDSLNNVIEPLTDDPDDPWDEPDGPRDAGSDYAESAAGSMFGSVTSSIHEHVWEYGRRYHSYRHGRYPIPNDEAEFKRESLRHIMFKELLDGKHYLAPIGSHPQKIIDLGTGFGDWAIEVGEALPSAKVIGVDLSPIQPVWIPPNVEFIVDDIEDNWVHDDDFDFMHLRFVGVTLKDNCKLFRTIFENLNPGGWVESQELFPAIGCDDESVKPNYPLKRFYKVCSEALNKKYGFETHFVEHLPQDLEKVGFVNVERRIFHIPIGEWPKDTRLRRIGGYFREILWDLVLAMAAKPFVEAGIPQAEIDEIVQGVAHTLGNKRFHAYVPVHFVWAQKPGGETKPIRSH